MAFGRGTSDRTQGDRGARLDAGVLRRDAAHLGRTAASRPKMPQAGDPAGRAARRSARALPETRFVHRR